MRRFFLILALASVGLLLVLAACNRDDDAADDVDVTEPESTEAVVADEPTAEPEPTATVEPTPVPEPTPTPDPTPSPEPTPTSVPDPDGEYTDEDMEQFLLTLEDMPTGWVVWEDDDDDQDENASADSDESAVGFCDAPPIEDELEGSAAAEAQFKAGDLGPFIYQFIGATLDVDETSRAMQWARDEFGCDEWYDEEEDILWTVTEMSFPALGDDMFAARAGAEIDMFTIEMDMVIIRRDVFFVVIVHLQLFGVDSEQTLAFAEAALDKLPE